MNFRKPPMSMALLALICTLTVQASWGWHVERYCSQTASGAVTGDLPERWTNIADGRKGEWSKGRILWTNPLIIEQFGQYPPVSNSLDDRLRFGPKCSVVRTPPVNESLKSLICQLHYGDIVEFQETLFWTADKIDGMPLGNSTISAIRKAPPLLNLRPFAWQEPPAKLVIRVIFSDHSGLFIYDDGTIYNTTSNSYLLTGIINETELHALLKQFDYVNFNALPANLSPDGASIILNCNRYQPVSYAGNEKQLGPLMSKLRKIADNLEQNAFRRLRYEKHYSIVDWHYGPLRHQGEDSCSADFIQELKTGTAYRMDGKIYLCDYVGWRQDINCAQWRDIRFTNADAYDWCIRSFPDNLGFTLGDIGPDGLLLSAAVYAKNRQFLANFPAYPRSEMQPILWRRNDELYRGLSVSLDAGIGQNYDPMK